MAWNRPSEDKAKVRGEQRNVHLKGLIAGAVVVVGAAVAAWWLWPTGESAGETPPPQTRRHIKAVQPVLGTNVVATTNAAAKPLPPQRVGELRNGYRLLPNGRMHKVHGVVTNRAAKISLADKIFDQSTDRSIAALLTFRPGDTVLGESGEYYKNFPKKFAESLKTPIVIKDDDSEEAKQLKQSVIDARAELKERMDAGEDLTKVMRESRDQMRELSLYHDDLEKQVRRIIADKDDLSKQDLKDLLGAANKMLKDRGSKPLYISSALAHQIRQRALKKNEQTKESKK